MLKWFEVFKTQVWYQAVAQEAGLDIHPWSIIDAVSMSQFLLEESMWMRFKKGVYLPQNDLIFKVDEIYPGTAKWFFLNLWDTLECTSGNALFSYDPNNSDLGRLFFTPDYTAYGIQNQPIDLSDSNIKKICQFDLLEVLSHVISILYQARINKSHSHQAFAYQLYQLLLHPISKIHELRNIYPIFFTYLDFHALSFYENYENLHPNFDEVVHEFPDLKARDEAIFDFENNSTHLARRIEFVEQIGKFKSLDSLNQILKVKFITYQKSKGDVLPIKLWHEYRDLHWSNEEIATSEVLFKKMLRNNKFKNGYQLRLNLNNNEFTSLRSSFLYVHGDFEFLMFKIDSNSKENLRSLIRLEVDADLLNEMAVHLVESYSRKDESRMGWTIEGLKQNPEFVIFQFMLYANEKNIISKTRDHIGFKIPKLVMQHYGEDCFTVPEWRAWKKALVN